MVLSLIHVSTGRPVLRAPVAVNAPRQVPCPRCALLVCFHLSEPQAACDASLVFTAQRPALLSKYGKPTRERNLVIQRMFQQNSMFLLALSFSLRTSYEILFVEFVLISILSRALSYTCFSILEFYCLLSGGHRLKSLFLLLWCFFLLLFLSCSSLQCRFSALQKQCVQEVYSFDVLYLAAVR